ncbi:hypothetical protein GCM10009425_47070 [Pseudomonas asuensis]|uniref:Uncharacterized protein n=1 Tax=Pseudomonas asuensis TaxID=1825787 RepID=A0ABQ2H358_9PSED|nr:hypothetical protein GCM10009425_47070 [Pseudomonas asuensis]
MLAQLFNYSPSSGSPYEAGLPCRGHANLIQKCLSLRDVASLTERKQNAPSYLVGITKHVHPGDKAASTAA